MSRKPLYVEIYQQSHLPAGQTAVTQYLRRVHRLKAFDGFDFNDDLVFDDQVDPVSRIEPLPSILQRERDLAFDFQASLQQLKHQTRFARGLENARAKRPMNIECRADNLFCNGVQPIFHVSVECKSCDSTWALGAS
jgi:hypothetical protein